MSGYRREFEKDPAPTAVFQVRKSFSGISCFEFRKFGRWKIKICIPSEMKHLLEHEYRNEFIEKNKIRRWE